MRHHAAGAIAVLLLGAFACYGLCSPSDDPDVPLPEGGKTYVPVDVGWETPLLVGPWGTFSAAGRPPVRDASAACAPPAVCVAAVVTPLLANDELKLTVAGAGRGLAMVEVDYVHPKKGTTIHARLPFEFYAADKLPTIDVGTAFPTTRAFLFPRLPAGAEVRKTPSGAAVPGSPPQTSPLRCERQAGDPEYVCFPIEEYGSGLLRYPSCDSSVRCLEGAIVDGYLLCLESSEGWVTAAAIFEGDVPAPGARRPTLRKPLGVWGAYTGSCAGAPATAAPADAAAKDP